MYLPECETNLLQRLYRPQWMKKSHLWHYRLNNTLKKKVSEHYLLYNRLVYFIGINIMVKKDD